ncbi:MAG: phosphoglycerate kinase [Syntrophomonadaceae bacterium]|nr:phosphoglycerate kinase [Syntrophomonadaceae bacterium]
MDVKDKRVLVRVDFNVPMDDEGNIIDDNRIQAALPTIRLLQAAGGRIVLMSHLGRPKGERKEQFSLKPVAAHLAGLMGQEVKMAPDCIGTEAEAMAAALKPGEILLLENLRFHKGEEKNEPGFCQALARLGDAYVNDAFGTAHRAHASTAGVADYLPAAAGLLLEKEVTMLRTVLEHPEPPRVAIMGGAKVADKLGLIRNLLHKMDVILLGGGMANTFIKAQGHEIGRSLCEHDMLEEARRIMADAPQQSVDLLLPVDVLISAEVSEEAPVQVVGVDQVPADMMIVDIGPRTCKIYSEQIKRAHTILWNGPMGVYEHRSTAQGTNQVALAIADADAVSVIGGGDSAAAAISLGLEDRITHISTGGGATLEFLEGLEMPGVQSCEYDDKLYVSSPAESQVFVVNAE